MRGPLVAYVSRRIIASHSSARVLPVAHTPVYPAAVISQPFTMRSGPKFSASSSHRSALGSALGNLAKKLSSSAAERPLWVSVPPAIPNLNGLAPRSCSTFRPFLRASRTYSCPIIPGFFGVWVRLPRSQSSHAAKSSVGDSDGCDSLWPFIWTASNNGSQRCRASAQALVIGSPLKVVIANIRPLERLPLCAIASSLPPVVFSHSVIHL